MIRWVWFTYASFCRDRAYNYSGHMQSCDPRPLDQHAKVIVYNVSESLMIRIYMISFANFCTLQPHPPPHPISTAIRKMFGSEIFCDIRQCMQRNHASKLNVVKFQSHTSINLRTYVTSAFFPCAFLLSCLPNLLQLPEPGCKLSCLGPAGPWSPSSGDTP